MIGSSSADIRQSVAWNVHGETIPARDLSRVTRAENFDAYAPGCGLRREAHDSVFCAGRQIRRFLG